MCGVSDKHGDHRHAARGLCKYCYKKLSFRVNHPGFSNYYQLVRDNPDAKQHYYDVSRQWRKTSATYKRMRRRVRMIMKFKNHIKNWFDDERRGKIQRRHKGVVIRIEHNSKTYLIRSPIMPADAIKWPNAVETYRQEVTKYLNDIYGANQWKKTFN